MCREKAVAVINYNELAEIYRLLASVPRLKILLHLGKGESTVSNLSELTGLTQSATSHQLKELRNCRIVQTRREGLSIYYSLYDEHILSLLNMAIEHIHGINCMENVE